MQTLSLERATRSTLEIDGIASRLSAAYRNLAESPLRPILVLASEVVSAVVACAVSVLLLTQVSGTPWEHSMMRSAVGASAATALIATLALRLYRRSLRYSNLLDLGALAEAVALNGIFLGGYLEWSGYGSHPIASLLVIDSLVVFLTWSFLHVSPRMLRAHRALQRKHFARAVIVGAGDAGLAILKEMVLDPSSPFRPVALVDDDKRKWGRSWFGVQVLGGTRELAKIAFDHRAEAVLVCVPSAAHSQMHRILDVCRRLSLPVRSLPSLPELIEGNSSKKVSPMHLTEARIEYLLQREHFTLDIARTRDLVSGKTVLITGAGGSIGSELARQIARARPEKLLLLDKTENSLFYANLELSERLGAERVRPLLADVSSINRTRNIFRTERPDLVFHAAAHKHVSMIELHPEEAIRNNVLGTRNLASAALEFGVESFVNISTDKAVAPQNFMGLSKKLTELCVQEFARISSEQKRPTRFSNVRFGNVAGSTGSVIRLFWEQIQRGGPIRVTDPQASRYFMSVSEAVHLILGAAEIGSGGETFVFDMGEPFNIYELAKTMTLFSGLRPHRDIAIEFIGLRNGEKLKEQLWDKWEHPVGTDSKRILAIREADPRSRGILPTVARIEESLERGDLAGMLFRIGELFPAFLDMGRGVVQASRSSLQTHNVAALGPIEAA